jgi:hypothetical protein
MMRLRSVIAFAILLGACGAQRYSHAECDVTDIHSLLASPLAFQGQQLCARGFLYDLGEMVAIYPERVTAATNLYDQTILLAANDGVVPSGSNIPVLVKGRIETAACNSDPDPDSSCVPISRAIVLEDWEVLVAE